VDPARIAATFVEMADTMINDFDTLDLLHLLTRRCVELLDADAAGILLASPAGRLQVAASTSRGARAVDLFQMQDEQGPGLDCYYTATPVAVENLAAVGSRWPKFAAEATHHGFTSVVALPMRLRGDVIGVLSLLAATGTALASEAETRVAQAMADACTLAILQSRGTEERRVAAEQLNHALQSRVVIEQGKGVLVTRLQVSEDEAFEMLRRRARATRRRLTEVADELRRRSPDSDWESYRIAKPSAVRHDDAELVADPTAADPRAASNGTEHGGRAEERALAPRVGDGRGQRRKPEP
jgi:GAF domain-containing protein